MQLNHSNTFQTLRCKVTWIIEVRSRRQRMRRVIRTNELCWIVEWPYYLWPISMVHDSGRAKLHWCFNSLWTFTELTLWRKIKSFSKMASPEHKKTRTGDNLPSTAATNRFSGRVAIVTGGASGIYPSHTTRYHCHIGRIAERSRSSCLLMLYNKSVYFELAHAQASCCSGSLHGLRGCSTVKGKYFTC